MLGMSVNSVKTYDYFAVYGIKESPQNSNDSANFPLKMSKVFEETKIITGIFLKPSEPVFETTQFQKTLEIGAYEGSSLYLVLEYQQISLDESAFNFKNSISKVELLEAETENDYIKIPEYYNVIPVPINGKYSHQKNGFFFYTGRYDLRPYIFPGSKNPLQLVLVYSLYEKQSKLLPLSEIHIESATKRQIDEEPLSQNLNRIPVLLVKNRRFFVCFKPINPFDLEYQAELIDRYPVIDSEVSPLNPGIPLFCFQEPLRLSSHEEPPTVFSFVLTTPEVNPENVVRIYVSSIVFYDRLKSKTVSKLGLSGSIFAPKCLCLVSHWPFIDKSEAILRSVLEYSRNTHNVPIERIVCNLIDEVVLYEDRITNFRFASMEFFKPPKYGLPYVPDMCFLKMFTKISIKNIINIWNALLLEKKVLIVSCNTSDLTYIIMGFTSLLFPLDWETMITILPEISKEFTGMIVSYIIGISDSTFESGIEIPEGCVILNLDTDTILNEQTIAKLPKNVYKNLYNQLINLIKKQGDLCENKNLLLIKDSFLEAQTCLLKDYYMCLKIKDDKLGFSSKKFLSAKERKNDQDFFIQFIQTQMFLQFLEKINCVRVQYFNDALKFKNISKNQCFVQKYPDFPKEISLNPSRVSISTDIIFSYKRFKLLKSEYFVEPRKKFILSYPTTAKTFNPVLEMAEPIWTNFLIRSIFELWLDIFMKYIPRFPDHVNELVCLGLIKMDEMKTLLVSPNQEMYSKIIEVCGIFNLNWTAKQIRNRMEKDGMNLDSFVHLVYLKAFMGRNSSSYQDEEEKIDLVLNRCTFNTNYLCPTCSNRNRLKDIIKNWKQSYDDISSKCRYCCEDIVPMFTVTKSLRDKLSVPLFPPHFLKKEIETQVKLNGKDFLLSRSFCDNSKPLFWNLVLYFEIFRLPFLWISPNFNSRNMNLVMDQFGKRTNIDINTDIHFIDKLPISKNRNKGNTLLDKPRRGIKKFFTDSNLVNNFNLKSQFNPLIRKFEDIQKKKSQLMEHNTVIFNRHYFDEAN